jgi:DNA-binding protein WhiA
MGVKIEKDVKNKINRKLNFELSNIDKTLDAAKSHLQAIIYIDEKCGIDSLPDNLREIARLRIENPEASLRDLGLLMDEPLSRSGVNHRLARIVSYAEKLKAGE